MEATSFDKAPEHLRPILDAFKEMAGFNPSPQLKKSWEVGAREWYENFHGDVGLLKQAVQQMLSQGLTVKSPQSAISIAQTITASGQKVKTLGVPDKVMTHDEQMQADAVAISRILEERSGTLLFREEVEQIYWMANRTSAQSVRALLEDFDGRDDRHPAVSTVSGLYSVFIKSLRE